MQTPKEAEKIKQNIKKREDQLMPVYTQVSGIALVVLFLVS